MAALTFFLMLGVLGLLGLLALTGLAHVPASGYLATGLVVVGAGLTVGAWFGRARSLITLGLVLLLGLPVAYAVDDWDPRQPVATQVEWVPATADELQDEYGISFGQGTLDLRQLDLTGDPLEVRVQAQGGEVVVLLPPVGEVTVHATVTAGSAEVFGRQIAGLGNRSTLSDPGQPLPDRFRPDGADPAPGGLTLHLDVRFGSIEVTR